MTMARSEPAAVSKHPARFTVEQFHRLCEAVPEQRLELIDGEVLQVIAKGTRHTAVVHHLITVIQAVLAAHPESALQLRVESPLDLGAANEPEPDLALVARRDDNYWTAHPTAADTALVIEVSDTSLTFDLEAKARLYAASGIPAYWVIDVQTLRLHVVHGGLEPAHPGLSPLLRSVEQLLGELPRR